MSDPRSWPKSSILAASAASTRASPMDPQFEDSPIIGTTLFWPSMLAIASQAALNKVSGMMVRQKAGYFVLSLSAGREALGDMVGHLARYATSQIFMAVWEQTGPRSPTGSVVTSVPDWNPKPKGLKAQELSGPRVLSPAATSLYFRIPVVSLSA